MQRLFFLLSVLFCLGVQAQVKNISINEVPENLKKKAVLVDVRTPGEYAEGHLPEALNIDVNTDHFTERIAKIRKNKAVLLYCRSGHRSARAAAIMDSLGYRKVYNLEGGYLAWDEARKQE